MALITAGVFNSLPISRRPLEFHFGRPFRYQSRTVIMSGLSMTGCSIEPRADPGPRMSAVRFPTSSTTMSSTPPPKKRFKKALQRGLDRSRDAILPTSGLLSPHPPPLSGTSTANGIPNVGIDIHDSVMSTPHPSSQQSQDTISSKQSASGTERNTSDKLKKAWGVTWSGLQTTLRLLEKSANAFPPLQSAVGGLVPCLDLAHVGYSCRFNTLY